MIATTETVKPFSQESVDVAIAAIVQVLGMPKTEAQREAIAAFNRQDHATVKRLAATNLGDHFCKALGYLGGAYKLTPNTDTILAEAARAAAEVAKDRVLEELGNAIASATRR